MYGGLINGSIFTIFILREFYNQSQLRTSLNLLLVLIFTSDCIRALFCAPLNSYVLIQTWNSVSNNCQGTIIQNESPFIILNICRLIVSIRTCYDIIQPLGFIGIAYERLRTIIHRNGGLYLNNRQRQENHRLKYAIIWIGISLACGISGGFYQGIAYKLVNTCYNHTTAQYKFALFVHVVLILIAALLSGIIYGKVYFVIEKYHKTNVIPIVNTIHSVRNQKSEHSIDIQRKDFRLAKNTFILFISFFLCRIPSIIIILTSLSLQKQSSMMECTLDELINFSYQLTFIAMITDPIVYIYSQPTLKDKFQRCQFCSYFK